MRRGGGARGAAVAWAVSAISLLRVVASSKKHRGASTSTTPAAMPPPPPEPRRPLLAVAPMIDVTDRHFRMLIRCVSPLPTLWTEMTWDRAILYNAPGEREHECGQKNVRPRSVESIIGFSEAERPIVLQLGGADPEPGYRAARVGLARGSAALW